MRCRYGTETEQAWNASEEGLQEAEQEGPEVVKEVEGMEDERK